MPKLRDIATGSVVNVDDELAARLGAGYEPLDDKPRRSGRRKPAEEDSD